MDTTEPITSQHYAFLIGEDDFDHAFARVTGLGLTYSPDPGMSQENEVNRRQGGRGFCLEDPDGHLLEVLTRARAGVTAPLDKCRGAGASQAAIDHYLIVHEGLAVVRRPGVADGPTVVPRGYAFGVRFPLHRRRTREAPWSPTHHAGSCSWRSSSTSAPGRPRH